MNRAVRIAQFLKADFILHPPCQTLNTAIADTLEKMKDCGQLKFDSVRNLSKTIPPVSNFKIFLKTLEKNLCGRR